MDKKSLEAKLEKAKGQFEELQKQEATFKEEGSELNRRFAALREEMVRVQGDYRTLEGLLKELEPKKVDSVSKK